MRKKDANNILRKNKKIELSIINYWFPFNHDFDDVENDFYANYLAVKIVYLAFLKSLIALLAVADDSFISLAIVLVNEFTRYHISIMITLE